MMSDGHFLSFIKSKTLIVTLDCHDFLAKYSQQFHDKTVTMHFVELMTRDVGWKIYSPNIFYFAENITQILKHCSCI